MRDCTKCGGFGEYMQAAPGTAPGSALVTYVSCVDCDGYGLLPSEDKAQSRRKSMIETFVSTAIGFAVSFALVAVVLPRFGYQTTFAHDFWITSIFTLASLMRGYCVRRMFEAWR